MGNTPKPGEARKACNSWVPGKLIVLPLARDERVPVRDLTEHGRGTEMKMEQAGVCGPPTWILPSLRMD
jgi:hypothetical protein